MLEQQTFTDSNGVEWLNRPGPKRGIPNYVPVIVAFPAFLLFTALFNGSAGIGLVAWMLITLVWYGFCYAANLCFLIYQTCPKCQLTRIRGYEKCAGCGYPQSWS